ncbi:MAG: hypothetical protein ACRDKJ_14930 [Actinomycetota bacterium]
MPPALLSDTASFRNAHPGPHRDADTHPNRSGDRDTRSYEHGDADTYRTTHADADPDAESHAHPGSHTTEPRAGGRGTLRVVCDDRIRGVDLASLPELRLLEKGLDPTS